MRPWLWLTLLSIAACDRLPPTSGDDDDAVGDDDDDAVGDDDDDDVGCEQQDADDDGADACDDCDDGDPLRFPGAPERCNELDDDCDGSPAAGEGPGCVVCDEAGFWSTTRGLTGEALAAELRRLTEPHTCADYSAATTFMFVELDKVDGLVTCVYTGRTTPVGNSKPDANDMNTEHTWPQSLGAENPPAECDLNHLYPTDSDANSTRGNLPLGVASGSVDWEQGGSKRGRDSSGRSVFEPRDDHKGNACRSLVYFSMQYGFAMDPVDAATCRDWNDEDPPDAAEIARSAAIADRQGAGNPFVFCPELVDAL